MCRWFGRNSTSQHELSWCAWIKLQSLLGVAWSLPTGCTAIRLAATSTWECQTPQAHRITEVSRGNPLTIESYVLTRIPWRSPRSLLLPSSATRAPLIGQSAIGLTKFTSDTIRIGIFSPAKSLGGEKRLIDANSHWSDAEGDFSKQPWGINTTYLHPAIKTTGCSRYFLGRSNTACAWQVETAARRS